MSHDDRCVRLRLAWFAYAWGSSVAKACRHFGTSRTIYYKWWGR